MRVIARRKSGFVQSELRLEHGDRIRQTHWIIAAWAGLAMVGLIYVALAAVVKSHHTNTAAVVRLLVFPPNYFVPEGRERAAFLLSALLAPAAILGSLLLLRARFATLSDGNLQKVWLGTVAAAVTGLGAFVAQLPRTSQVLQEFFPPTPYPWGRRIAGALATVFALWLATRKKRASRLLRMVGFVISGAAVLVLMLLFTVSSVHAGPARLVDGENFNTVLYSVAQIAHGSALLVNVVNQYGFYAQAIGSLFEITGFNILAFTLLMAILLAAAFAALAVVFWQNLRKAWLAPVAWFAVVHYAYFCSRGIAADDVYLQYHPIRFFFPAVALFLFSRYVYRPSRRMYAICVAAAACAVFWNLDSGMAVWGSWIALLAFREFGMHAPREALRRAATHVLTAGVAVCAGVLLYSIYTLCRYQVFPDWSALALAPRAFAEYGLLMLPMPADHPWMLVIAVYAVALARAGYAAVHRELTERDQIVFAMAALGLGLFFYYQGRSHDNNLVMVAWPAVMLLGFFADDLLIGFSRASDHHTRWFFGAAAVPLAFLFCYPIVMGPDLIRECRPILAAKIAAFRSPESALNSANLDLLQRYSHRGERIALLSLNAGSYHAETGTANWFRGPGLRELLWRSQARDRESQLSQIGDRPVIVDFRETPAESLDSTAQLQAAAMRDFEFVEQNMWNGGSIGVYCRKQGSAWWRLSEQPGHRRIAHTRYDPARIKSAGAFSDYEANRLRIAAQPFTAKDIVLEMIVRPDEEQTGSATLINTEPGSANYRGFMIQHLPDKLDTYVLSVGNGGAFVTGPEFRLPSNALDYICVVIHGETLHVWVNGVDVSKFQIPLGMADSDYPVLMGNSQQLDQPFDGLIEEVYLREGTLSESEVQRRWTAVQPALVAQESR